jgi:hypothetical protein
MPATHTTATGSANTESKPSASRVTSNLPSVSMMNGIGSRSIRCSSLRDFLTKVRSASYLPSSIVRSCNRLPHSRPWFEGTPIRTLRSADGNLVTLSNLQDTPVAFLMRKAQCCRFVCSRVLWRRCCCVTSLRKRLLNKRQQRRNREEFNVWVRLWTLTQSTSCRPQFLYRSGALNTI